MTDRAGDGHAFAARAAEALTFAAVVLSASEEDATQTHLVVVVLRRRVLGLLVFAAGLRRAADLNMSADVEQRIEVDLGLDVEERITGRVAFSLITVRTD